MSSLSEFVSGTQPQDQSYTNYTNSAYSSRPGERQQYSGYFASGSKLGSPSSVSYTNRDDLSSHSQQQYPESVEYSTLQDRRSENVSGATSVISGANSEDTRGLSGAAPTLSSVAYTTQDNGDRSNGRHHAQPSVSSMSYSHSGPQAPSITNSYKSSSSLASSLQQRTAGSSRPIVTRHSFNSLPLFYFVLPSHCTYCRQTKCQLSPTATSLGGCVDLLDGRGTTTEQFQCFHH